MVNRVYTGNYQRRAHQLRQDANRDPTTACLAHCTCNATTLADCTCGKACGRPLHEHPTTRTGRPPRWSAGHTNPGNPHAAIRPEVLGCNVAERNDRINATPPTRLYITRTW